MSDQPDTIDVIFQDDGHGVETDESLRDLARRVYWMSLTEMIRFSRYFYAIKDEAELKKKERA